jgi:hypothetical protein
VFRKTITLTSYGSNNKTCRAPGEKEGNIAASFRHRHEIFEYNNYQLYSHNRETYYHYYSEVKSQNIPDPQTFPPYLFGDTKTTVKTLLGGVRGLK